MSDYYKCKSCHGHFDIPEKEDKEAFAGFRVGLCVDCNKEIEKSLAEYKDKMMRPAKSKNKGL